MEQRAVERWILLRRQRQGNASKRLQNVTIIQSNAHNYNNIKSIQKKGFIFEVFVGSQ
jgi:hypothetical protein